MESRKGLLQVYISLSGAAIIQWFLRLRSQVSMSLIGGAT